MRDAGRPFLPSGRKPQPCDSCGHTKGFHWPAGKNAHKFRCTAFGCECPGWQQSLADVARRESAEPRTNGSDHATVGGLVPLADARADSNH